MTDVESDRIERARARAVLYHYLSTLFVQPELGTWQTLQELSAEEWIRVLAFLDWRAAALAPLSKILRETTPERFVAEHRAIFGHTAAGELRPYEAGYDSNHVFQETQCLADVAGFYRAFGLEPSDARRERPDHIAVELEFMHALALKEAYALGQRWTDQAELCRRAEIDFLRDHLGRWSPSFLKHLSDRANGGIFQSVADATAACVEAHCHDLGVGPGPSDLGAPPVSPEPEGVNFSCAASCLGGSAESVTGEGRLFKEEQT